MSKSVSQPYGYLSLRIHARFLFCPIRRRLYSVGMFSFFLSGHVRHHFCSPPGDCSGRNSPRLTSEKGSKVTRNTSCPYRTIAGSWRSRPDSALHIELIAAITHSKSPPRSEHLIYFIKSTCIPAQHVGYALRPTTNPVRVRADQIM